MDIKHPNVKVQLVGRDGNAFAIIARVRHALREAGISEAEIKAFTDEAMARDYDNLLVTCMKWVNVE